MVMAGSTRFAKAAGTGDGQPSQLDREQEDQDRPQREVLENERPKRLTTLIRRSSR